MPKLAGIDHVHVYVGDRDEALRWYFEVLGFRPLEEFSAWATKNGPLTLGDATGSVHLALFERKGVPPTSTIAFGATAGAARKRAARRSVQTPAWHTRISDWTTLAHR